MSINLLIKQRLRSYLQLLRDINDHTRYCGSNDDDNVITSNIKATLHDVMCSTKLREQLTQRSCVNKEMLMKRNRNVNVSCFGQRCLWNVNQFCCTVNEVDLINVNLCYLMFDVVKACLMHGFDIKGRYARSQVNFVLTPKMYNKKRCLFDVYRGGGGNGVDDKHSETGGGMSMISKLRVCCNRSVESSHNNNNTKYMSVKVGTTPRLKELTPSLSNNHVKRLFNISKTRRESLRRQAPYGQRKGYLKVGYYVKAHRHGDISASLSKHNVNGYNNNYKEIFKYYNMLNYS